MTPKDFRIITNGHRYMPQIRMFWFYWSNLRDIACATREDAQAMIDYALCVDAVTSGPWRPVR